MHVSKQTSTTLFGPLRQALDGLRVHGSDAPQRTAFGDFAPFPRHGPEARQPPLLPPDAERGARTGAPQPTVAPDMPTDLGITLYDQTRLPGLTRLGKTSLLQAVDDALGIPATHPGGGFVLTVHTPDDEMGHYSLIVRHFRGFWTARLGGAAEANEVNLADTVAREYDEEGFGLFPPLGQLNGRPVALEDCSGRGPEDGYVYLTFAPPAVSMPYQQMRALEERLKRCARVSQHVARVVASADGAAARTFLMSKDVDCLHVRQRLGPQVHAYLEDIIAGQVAPFARLPGSLDAATARAILTDWLPTTAAEQHARARFLGEADPTNDDLHVSPGLAFKRLPYVVSRASTPDDVAPQTRRAAHVREAIRAYTEAEEFRFVPTLLLGQALLSQNYEVESKDLTARDGRLGLLVQIPALLQQFQP